MGRVGYSRLQQVNEWLQWVTAGYSRIPSGCSGIQQFTADYRVVKVGYSRLLGGYGGLQQVTAGNRMVTVGYIRSQQFIEWVQWFTQVTAVTEWLQ